MIPSLNIFHEQCVFCFYSRGTHVRGAWLKERSYVKAQGVGTDFCGSSE